MTPPLEITCEPLPGIAEEVDRKNETSWPVSVQTETSNRRNFMGVADLFEQSYRQEISQLAGIKRVTLWPGL
jgi:hypothetical protein